MITGIIEHFEENEEENINRLEELVTCFNKIAKNNRSQYRMGFNENKVILFKPIIAILNIGTSIIPIFVKINKQGDFFFEEGIQDEIFKDIEKLLIQLNQPFLIEKISEAEK